MQLLWSPQSSNASELYKNFQCPQTMIHEIPLRIWDLSESLLLPALIFHPLQAGISNTSVYKY